MQCKPATCRGALVPGAASQQIKETARGRPRGPGLLTATGEREANVERLVGRCCQLFCAYKISRLLHLNCYWKFQGQ
ncbi:Serine carboxypeptidase K10B2.2 [Zea mays]|nr:Serine carboxypeptidase K10B2.2 [Zea mays]ONM29918.1 Serine carboxypeptidase K10B2.2 [Zea mays]